MQQKNQEQKTKEKKDAKKKQLKRKKKQSQKKEVVLDYFPRGNIFCNEESTQIKKKNIENDFIFNQSLYTFSSKPQNKKTKQTLKEPIINEYPISEGKRVLANDQADEDEPWNYTSQSAQTKDSKQLSYTRKDINKIPAIAFEKGNFCMMAVCQVNKYYMITNYTRNKKAYVNQANAAGQLIEDYKAGDFVFGTIMQGRNRIIKDDVNQKVDVSRKFQLGVNPLTFNFGVSVQNLVPGVALMGVISQIEQSGCYVELGLKDESKGFIKQSNLGSQVTTLKEGKPINLVVSKVSKKSKIISCLPIFSENGKILEIERDKISFDALRPGSRVKAKVVEKYQNGITVKFLNHFSGSIFIDHLQKNPKSYKKDQEINARIIAVKQNSKLIALSNLPHILQFEPSKISEYGTKIQEAKVQKIVCQSLILNSKNLKNNVIMHRTNIPTQSLEKIKTGFIFPQVFLKQFNYFDNIAVAKPSSNLQATKQLISIQSLKIGQILTVQILSISSNVKSMKKAGISVGINNYLRAFVPLHHLADIPLHEVPSRYKKGKSIKAAVFMKNSEEKYIELTMKPKLLEVIKNGQNLFQKKDYLLGTKCCGVVINAKDKIGLFLQFFGDVFGIIYEEEVQSIGRELGSFKIGEILEVYVKSNSSQKRMLILSFKPVKVIQPAKIQRFKTQKVIDHMSVLNSQKKGLKTEKLNTIVGRILLPSSTVIENDQIFKEMYQPIQQKQFLVKFDLPKQKGLYAILNNLGIIFKQSILSRIKSQYSGQESIQIEFKVQKIDNNVPFVSYQSIKHQSTNNFKGEYVMGLVQSVKQQMGCVFKLIGKSNLKGFARKGNLKNFDLARYKIGSVHKLKIDGSKQQKLFVSNISCNSLIDQELEIITEIVDNENKLIKSFLHYDIDFFELYKVKLIQKKDSNQIVVKTKKGQILAVKLINSCKQEVSKRLWIRFIDFQNSFLIAQSIDSKKYGNILQEHKDSDKYQILYQKQEYSIIENKKSMNLKVLIKQNFLSVSTEELTKQIGKQNIVNIGLKNFSVLNNYRGPKSISQEYEFKIQNIFPTSIQGVVQFEDNKKVKVSKAQIPQQLVQIIWTSDNTQNTLKGRHLFPKYVKRDFLQLTLLPESHPNVTSLDNQLSKNQQFRAVVQVVNLKSSSPIIISTSLKQRGSIIFSSIPLNYLPSEEAIIDLRKVFEPGQMLNVYFSSQKQKGKKDSQSYYSHHYFELCHQTATTPINIGSKVIGRCFRIIQGKGVIVQLNQSDYGFLDPCQMIDDFIYNPMQYFFGKDSLFQKQGCCYCIFRVIGKDQSHSQKWVLSMRKSHTDDKSFKQLNSSSQSNVQTIEKFLQKGCDYRNLLFKYKNIKADKLLKQGALVLGYVSNCSQKGCFVKIAQGVVVRAALHQLDDVPTHFDIGSLILARITSINQKGQINITARKSNLLYGKTFKLKQFQVGSIVACIVTASAHRKLFVQIKGTSFRGKVKLRKEQDFENGREIFCKITKKMITQKVPKFKFDIIMDESKNEMAVNNIEQDEIAGEFLELLKKQKLKKSMGYEQIKEGADQQEQIDDGHKLVDELNALKELEKIKSQNILDQSQADQEEDDEQYQEDQELKILQDMKQDEQSDIDSDQLNEQNNDQNGTGQSEDDDIQSNSQSSFQKQATLKRKTKKKLKERIAQQKKIRQIERLQASQSPKTSEQYQKLLIKQPQIAINWIQYAAFGLQNSKSNGLQVARTIFQRAVKKISITNEMEKLNLWAAYLNLEHYYGDIETFNKVLKRALAINDQQQVYLKIIRMYIDSHEHQILAQLFPKIIKKFKTSCQLWDLYLQWAFRIQIFRRLSMRKEGDYDKFQEIASQSESEDDGKNRQQQMTIQQQFSAQQQEKIGYLNLQKVIKIQQVLKNSIHTLSKPEHINLITKCARLEYQSKFKENGRTLFQGLLKNSPRRLDIWAIYFDCEIKHSSKGQVRQLFEKSIKLKSLPIQKVKFFFKRYLDFQMKHGEDEERIEEIKEKARAFIESVQDRTQQD